jgi:hypothetical protein
MSQGGGKLSAGPAKSTVSELEDLANMSPVDLSKLRTELETRQTFTPEQAAANREETAMGLAYSTPVLGNILSIRQAYEDRDLADALEAAGELEAAEQARASAAANVAGGFMPSMGGLGSVKGAALRPGVFVPIEASRARTARSLVREMTGNPEADQRHAMRQLNNVLGEGDRRAFFGPEGKLKSEISDRNITVSDTRFLPGNETTLGKVIDHPELFAEMPELKNIPVRFGKAGASMGNGVARTTPDGAFELMPKSYDSNKFSGWMKQNIAKLLQYHIGEKAGFAAGTKHDAYALLKELDRTIDDVSAQIDAGKLGDRARIYLKYLNRNKNEVQREMKQAYDNPLDEFPTLDAKYGGSGQIPARREVSKELSKRLNDKTAGNIEARYVYDASRFPRERPNYRGAVVIPPKDADLDNFINDWLRYGQGATGY